jgi:putative copper resistance protein D
MIAPAAVLAHSSGHGAPLDWPAGLARAEFAPLVTGLLVIAAALYSYGAWRVRQRHPARPWPRRWTASFVSGLVMIAVATQSFIGAYDDALFWTHMVQHLLLIMVAPPLLVLGRPATLLLHASRNPLHRIVTTVLRSRPVSVLTHPIVGLSLYAGTVVGTHLTNFMNLVVTNAAVHNAEHALYLLVGFLFFLPLVGREPIRWRLSWPSRTGLLILAMPVDTFTGVVLNEATSPMFPAYQAGRPAWAPSALHDLHIGGAIMWVGGDWIMLIAILLGFVAWAHTAQTGGGVGRWLEAARRSAFDAHTSGADPPPNTAPVASETIDDDESLDAYNAWLGRLGRPDTTRSPHPAGSESPAPHGRTTR